MVPVVTPPLRCRACGAVPALLRLVDLEAEATASGAPRGELARLGPVYEWSPRCAACWAAFRKRGAKP